MKKTALLLSLILFICCGFTFSSCGCSKDTTSNFYDICVTYDETEKVLSGYETVTFKNDSENAFNELKFNLFGNAFRKDAKFKPILSGQDLTAYYNGESYGKMEVSAVEFDGEKIAYSIGGEDENILIVKLKDTLYPEETVTVKIYFSLHLANVLSRTGYNDKTVNLGNFYPVLCAVENGAFKECVYYAIGDPFYSEVADYKTSITVSSNLTVCSSGELINATEKGDKKTYSYTLKKARDFAFVLSSEFDLLTKTENGVTINYYYYNDLTPKDTLDISVKAIKTFSNAFINYPYKTYSLCQTGFIEGGMEYPCLSMISDALTDKAVIEEVAVHETAHQWWYSLVGNDEISHAFLDEGLTEYSVVLFYEKNPEYQVTRTELIGTAHKSYSTFCSIYDKIFGKKDTSMLRSLKEFSSSYEYVNIAYIKGALMFDYLRTAVGDTAFFNGLKKYATDYSYKIATPDSLVGVFEKIGANTNGFFKSWFNGEVIL